MSKPRDLMRSMLDLVFGLMEVPAQGAIKIPSVRYGRDFGTIVLTRDIVIHEPTREKVEAELRKLWASDFQGNVILPRKMEDPFIIHTEEHHPPAYRLL